MRMTYGLVLGAALIQGCAQHGSDSSRQLNCDALHTVIGASQDSFASIAGQQATTKYGNTWGSRISAFGNDCILLSGTQTPRTYFCAIADQDQAAGTKVLTEAVATCLGPNWQRQEFPSRPATRFTRAEDNVVVDVGASDVAASRATVVGLTVRNTDTQSQGTDAESVARNNPPSSPHAAQ